MASNSVFRFTATRPVAITMVVAAALVFGFVGLARLPVNLLPDISYPSVTVRTTYPGASPRDVEERVSERVQESVAVISSVRRVVSISRPEVSDVILEFGWGTQMVFAVSDIRERLDRVMLPREANDPLVLRYDPSLDPVVTIGLSGDDSLIELRRIAEEEVERELAEVEGVAAVKLRGGDEEEIRISIDEDALSSFGIDVATLSRRLAAENVNAASGAIEEGKSEYLVRVIGEFPDLDDIANLVLERRSDAPIRIRDVATVRRVASDKEVISLVDGQPCVLIDIYKEAGSNVVDLCRRVRERVYGSPEQQRYVAAGRHLTSVSDVVGRTPEQRAEAFRKRTERLRMTDFLELELQPLGVRFDTLQDQSRFIQSSVDDVLDAAIKGGLFAIAVIYLFLRRFAATAILAVSMPVSLVATFAPMYMSDIDLNIMSLGGLALGVGMLVDNSIVVLEAIARARESGRSRQDAAVVGVSTVAAAVTASTLTTVAVFFPIVFVEGIAGQLFRDQALTVVFALLISLGVALFLIPMLATRTAPSTSEAERASFGHLPRLAATGLFGRIVATILWPLRLLSWFLQGCLTWLASSLLRALLLAVRLSLWIAGVVIWPIAAAFNRAYAALDAVYPRVLAGALGNRGIVVVLALGLLVAAGLRVPALGSEVLPEVHQGELYVDVFLPRDASVERTSEVLAPIEAAVAKLPDVGRTFVASGVDKDELNDSDQGEHSARLLVRMVPNADRTSQEERVRETIRSIMRRTPEVQTYRFSRPSVLSFDAPLVVEVLGHDLQQLRIACQQVVDSLRTVPGLRDVRSTLQRGNPEISIQLDRERLAALDIEPGDVVQTLRAKVQGDVPTRFTERERKVDIRVRVDQRDLATMTELLSLNVNPKGQPLIPLETVASIQQIEGPSEIRRIGNLRGAEVQAALVGLDLGSTQQRVMAALAGLKLPRAIEVRLGSQSEALEQSSRSLTEALLLAIFLVYIVMASQFESLRQPLIIMASLPLAMVGAIFALDALGIALSVVVFLGAIVLAGIVVNNAIILVDQINRVRAGGAAKRDAIIRGAHTRLRPVLMTTMTTVLGLLPLTGWLGQLPLLGGSGEGLELRAPMAITVITGLLSSTVLTLIVVPVIYSLSDRRA